MTEQSISAVIERRVRAVLKCQPWDGGVIVGEDDDTLTVVRGAKTWTLDKARTRYMIEVRGPYTRPRA